MGFSDHPFREGDDSPFRQGDDEFSRPHGVLGILQLWFGLRHDVGRPAFTISGLTLMLLKYAVEASVIGMVTGNAYTLLNFLSPVYTLRAEALQNAPSWLQAALLVWTLPFLWIAVSMSIRRAANAGISPWWGFLVLVPGLNFLWMIAGCILPTAPGRHWEFLRIPEKHGGPSDLWAGTRALLIGLLATAAMVVASVYLAGSYGAALFFATPLLVGAVTAYDYNRPVTRSLAATIGISVVAICLVGAGMLLFALEGVICLAMAFPLAVAAGIFGAVLGKVIADYTPRRQSFEPLGALLFLPLLAVGELQLPPAPLNEVVTTIEIDAPPEVVWRNVVAFPELPEEREWYFRLGIACPERARIEGYGAGATRYCIFSTGEFVEPIRVWDEPRRLAFDVTDQPATMKELSPYREVHAPHLEGVLQSRRGEFLLIPLPGGRTRLEGRTWYTFEMHPQAYWTAWSNAIIHRIHLRVLRHIREISEAEATALLEAPAARIAPGAAGGPGAPRFPQSAVPAG
jgi:hypothetical protein